MKKGASTMLKLTLFIVIFLFSMIFVSASSIKLAENSTWEANLTGVYRSSIALGDIDNDNDNDMVLIGLNSNDNKLAKIYLNNGTSLVENSTWEANLTGAYWGSLAWGDIDNDGDLDLALKGCLSSTSSTRCTGGSYTAKVYINNGTGLIENSTWQQNLEASSEGSLAFGDVNLDGKLDLALVGFSANGYNAKIYLNNGTSLVENSTWETNLEGAYQAFVSFGDYDNDGDLDLSFSGERETSPYKVNRIYTNNGISFIENITWEQSLTAIDKSSAIWSDFDNDNDMDLIMIGCCDRFFVYENNGIKLNENQTDTVNGGNYLVGIFEGSIGTGDYDNDGDLDLVGIGRETERNHIYENNNNVFQDDTTAESDLRTHNVQKGSLAWGDLDNDNNLDLIVTGLSYIGEDPSDALTKVYTSNASMSNTKPTPPTILNATYQNGQLILRWNNGSDAETPSTGLYYNLKVGASANKHSIVSGVYGGGDDNGYFGNMMQRKSITLNVDLGYNETVFWSVQTIDTALANGSWSLEQNYTIPIDTTTPIITLNSPVNGFNTSNPIILFNATIFDDNNLTNVTLYGNWTGSLIANESNTSGINNTYYVFSKDLTVFGDGMYSWYITAEDNANNTATSAARIFRIDTTYPQINISSPANASTWTSSSTVTFTYNVTDANIANCSLIINNAIDQTDTSVTVNIAQTFTKSLSNAVYTWSVNCTDYAGLQNNSETRTVTVSYTAPSDGGSSSGGGGSGGGGGGGSGSAKETQTVSAQAGEEKTVSFTKDFGVTEIAVTPTKKLSSESVTVEEVKAADSAVVSAGSIGSNVYKYLKITSKAEVEKAKIKFKVSLGWFAQQDYDENTVALKHYTDKWESLPTEKISRDSKYAYYEAETAGFSLFAITAEKKAVEMIKEKVAEEGAGNATEKAENVTGEIAGNVTERKEEIVPEKEVKWYLLLIAVIILVGFGFLVYYGMRKK